MSESNISCPNCGHPINIDEAFVHQAEDRIKKEFEAKAARQATLLNQQREKLENERKQLEEFRQTENERLRKKLNQERDLLREQENKRIREEYELQMKQLSEENARRKDENQTLKKRELELLQAEKSLQEKQEQAELEIQKKLLEKETEIRSKIQQGEQEKNQLKFKEYEKQLNDQKKLIEEMKRKAEQGSMQMQGEVQELAIEEYLKQQFPLDTISEIKKGARGADCIQTIHTREQTNCGMIYYESKRTKEFQPTWIEKFKSDMRTINAHMGVLVTEAMPKDMPKMGQRDGIWICSFEEFKGLSRVLRDSVIKINQALASQENKGDKMSLLYDFLTSNEFRLQIEGIVEGFAQMQEDLNREKRAMEGIWKRREKQLHKVLRNTNEFYNSVKGIAGNAIGSIDALELPGADQDDLDSV
ncbi:DUF2130 domain-containing protein [bacterium SCSIO 12741]|nr:DUF2130 domain-containing protein [bacterium SCSIO 12741]